MIDTLRMIKNAGQFLHEVFSIQNSARRVPNAIDLIRAMPSSSVVPRFRPDRPYLEAWLRRFSREMSGSGALSQTAHRLAQDLGGTAETWKSQLSDILSGQEKPTIDLVTQIDALWSKQTPSSSEPDSQGLLF
jgi:hypothetical protein